MNWDDYFFSIIAVVREKSKDNSTKVGAVIANKDNVIVSTGFNGFPRGVYDKDSDVRKVLLKERVPFNAITKEHFDKTIVKRCSRPLKYLFTEHAERNAIYAAAKHGISLENCKIYVDWFPCADCCRAIIQSGINEIIIDYRDSETKERLWNERWKESINATKQMCEEAEILIRRWTG